MIYRYHLLLLSVLFSCIIFAQENSINKLQEPILGYYHLGMNYDEYWNQAQKMQKDTEVADSGSSLSKYLISINNITFDVTDLVSPPAFIGVHDYENYTKETLPLFFTGGSYCLENKLVSVTIETPNNENTNFLCYMPAGLYEQKDLPKNRCLFDVYNVEYHNQLVSLSENLKIYLSKKYGPPSKEYPIATLQPLGKDELDRQLPVCWFSLCVSGAILPKAEWLSGNMKIIMGITNAATIFISFLDEMQLSHQNLDRIFAPAEQPKPKVEW